MEYYYLSEKLSIVFFIISIIFSIIAFVFFSSGIFQVRVRNCSDNDSKCKKTYRQVIASFWLLGVAIICYIFCLFALVTGSEIRDLGIPFDYIAYLFIMISFILLAVSYKGLSPNDNCDSDDDVCEKKLKRVRISLWFLVASFACIIISNILYRI